VIRLKIPTILRGATDDVSVLEVDAATVGEALAAAIDRHPDLAARLFDDDGTLRRFINVFVEGHPVRARPGYAGRAGANGLAPAGGGGRLIVEVRGFEPLSLGDRSGLLRAQPAV